MPSEDLFTPTKYGRAADQAPAPSTENAKTGSGTFVLVADTARTIAVPADSVIAWFSPEIGNNFYWNLAGTATIPAADDDGADPSMLNPVMVNVSSRAGSTISVKSISAMNLTVMFF